jgi:hypothetical protein
LKEYLINKENETEQAINYQFKARSLDRKMLEEPNFKICTAEKKRPIT